MGEDQVWAGPIIRKNYSTATYRRTPVCVAWRQVPGRSPRPGPGDASGFPSWRRSAGFGPHRLALTTARSRVWFLRAAARDSPVLCYPGKGQERTDQNEKEKLWRTPGGGWWDEMASGSCDEWRGRAAWGGQGRGVHRAGASWRPRLLRPCSGSVLLQGFCRDPDASVLSGRGGQSLAAWVSQLSLSNPRFTPHCERPRGGHPKAWGVGHHCEQHFPKAGSLANPSCLVSVTVWQATSAARSSSHFQGLRATWLRSVALCLWLGLWSGWRGQRSTQGRSSAATSWPVVEGCVCSTPPPMRLGFATWHLGSKWNHWVNNYITFCQEAFPDPFSTMSLSSCFSEIIFLFWCAHPSLQLQVLPEPEMYLLETTYTHFPPCVVPGTKCPTHVRTDVTFRLFPIHSLLQC